MNYFKYSVIVFSFILITDFSFSQSYKLIWSDEFDGTQLNTGNWNREVRGDGGGNNELQYYTDRAENSSVSDGLLTITANQEQYNGMAYTSARLNTQGIKNFKYGKIEANIKMPYGKGIWPAFWMLGKNITTVGWPSCGEIDIMEMIGSDISGTNILGNKQVIGTAHYTNNINLVDRYLRKYYTLSSGIFADAFHRFSIVWEPKKIEWYVDDTKYFTTAITGDSLSELRDSAYIILNLAVGGDWPGSPNGNTVFPKEMLVDYVRVYIDSLAEPKVKLISPTADKSIPLGEDINISTDVSCPDVIKVVEFYQDAVKIGETTVKPYQITWRGIKEGCYKIKANAISERGFIGSSETIDVKVGANCIKSPYKGYLNKIPGRIEMENFDNGVAGDLGYFDNDATVIGGEYRPNESVDIKPCTYSADGYYVSSINTGEWLSFSVNVSEATNYNFDVRDSSFATGSLSIIVDNNSANAIQIDISNTGVWKTFSKSNVQLSSGVHAIMVIANTSGFNLNYIDISKSAQPTFITLTSPNGGEVLQGGTVGEIRWESSKVDVVGFYFSSDGVDNFGLLPIDCPAEFGSCRFILPNTVSKNCLIMVYDKNNSSTNVSSNSPFEIIAASGINSVQPKNFDLKLFPVFPNPANPGSTVRFSINESLPVSLYIYDINGRLVSSPVKANYSKGTHEIRLSTKEFASGVYQVVLHAGNAVQHTKMIVLK